MHVDQWCPKLVTARPCRAVVESFENEKDQQEQVYVPLLGSVLSRSRVIIVGRSTTDGGSS